MEMAVSGSLASASCLTNPMQLMTTSGCKLASNRIRLSTLSASTPEMTFGCMSFGKRRSALDERTDPNISYSGLDANNRNTALPSIPDTPSANTRIGLFIVTNISGSSDFRAGHVRGYRLGPLVKIDGDLEIVRVTITACSSSAGCGQP